MRLLRRVLLPAAVGALRGIAFGLEVVNDLTPGFRMARRRRLPDNLGAGILGAEIATWWAISPSLLPRPWWVTAANVAIVQGVGHLAGTAVAYPLRRRWSPRAWLWAGTGHMLMVGVTASAALLSLRRQEQQARLVRVRNRGSRHALAGAVVGTAGYGALLLVGDAAQAFVDRTGARLSRWMPLWVAWPLTAGGLTWIALLLSDKVLVRRVLARLSRQAAVLNASVFPGSMMPWEPERSGSPWSLEPWSAVGSQGRAVLSLGPRARDIAEITGLREVREPIRIFVGLVPGRTVEAAARLILAEMDRTGAFRRDTLVIQTSAGTGWVTDWSVDAVEFLTGGNCATMSMQYSYLPSPVAYVVDRDTPVRAARALIAAVLSRLEQMDPADRPRLYVAGESLGAYGTAAAFDDLDDLLRRTDGALLSGAPRFTRLIRDLSDHRDAGSPERLPLIDGGRHVRVVATPLHLRQDHLGRAYRHPWQYPRVVIAQHASDPIVWFSRDMVWRQPDWLREPGSRGVPAPRPQRLDVFHGMRWVPFVSGWQVGLDQLNSLAVPGGHGHNYHEEMLWYWDAVLGEHASVRMDHALERRASAFIRRDAIRR
ncbi:alpha/beta-hydrolase family protein [Corynebacterium sp.]|uniref:alpha/beta-hydrolase family protein n=1 Tax=Corynebacterium sp. TaxID=1720 RepID=UPI0026E046CE|nr:alpha/beta-hydrolase family protein [Corynebacterium sp.]MDO5511286.1 alpha/beta-hydrolase family protein [Corynebacterium sp.]